MLKGRGVAVASLVRRCSCISILLCCELLFFLVLLSFREGSSKLLQSARGLVLALIVVRKWEKLNSEASRCADVGGGQVLRAKAIYKVTEMR